MFAGHRSAVVHNLQAKLPSLLPEAPLSLHTFFHPPTHPSLCREAAKRGDILFVGSSGNNGTTPTLKDGKLTSSLNPGNFPGTALHARGSLLSCTRVLGRGVPSHALVVIAERAASCAGRLDPLLLRLLLPLLQAPTLKSSQWQQSTATTGWRPSHRSTRRSTSRPRASTSSPQPPGSWPTRRAWSRQRSALTAADQS